MDSETRGLWTYRLLFVVLCIGLVAYRLVPLGVGEYPLLPGPDLMLALTLAWLLRQPDTVPPLIIVGVMLLADFVFMRPPGLWALLVLLVTEYLRRRRATMAEMPFFLEWLTVGAAIFALLILNRLALAVLIVEQGSLGRVVLHGLVTIAVYPIVVGISKYVLGVHMLGPQDTETP